jgi:group I intron endonuclease
VIGVYAIVNRATGRAYIGSSIDVRERLKAHRSLLRRGKHHCIRLQRAWNKSGQSAFVFQLVLECREDELRDREQHIMDLSGSYNTLAEAGKPTRIPDDVRKRMSVGSRRAGLDPRLRRLRSENARAQHARGGFGEHWTRRTGA